MPTEKTPLPIGVEEQADEIAALFWSVHPRMLQDKGQTREQFYADELKAYARAVMLVAPELKAPEEAEKLLASLEKQMGELEEYTHIADCIPRDAFEGVAQYIIKKCASIAALQSHHAFWCGEAVNYFPTERDQHVAGVVARNISRAIMSKIRTESLYEKFLSEGKARDDMTPLTFAYTNYDGKKGTRNVYPIRHWFGRTEWHPTDQWLLKAWDLDKKALRDFAVTDIIYNV